MGKKGINISHNFLMMAAVESNKEPLLFIVCLFIWQNVGQGSTFSHTGHVEGPVILLLHLSRVKVMYWLGVFDLQKKGSGFNPVMSAAYPVGITAQDAP